MRGPCRVKPFDLDLTWMSKYRNPCLAQFWSAETDVERLDLIKIARGGGSLTPTYYVQTFLKHTMPSPAALAIVLLLSLPVPFLVLLPLCLLLPAVKRNACPAEPLGATRTYLQAVPRVHGQ
jgi:hypothetical protein